MFKISIVSPSATYNLTSSSVSYDEGTTATILLTTAGVQRGQPLPFTISGTGITLEDFEGLTSLSGQFVVGADGTSTVNLSIRNDQALEGVETFRLTLANGTFVDVVINDTSAVTPALLDMELRTGFADLYNNAYFTVSSAAGITFTSVGSTTAATFGNGSNFTLLPITAFAGPTLFTGQPWAVEVFARYTSVSSFKHDWIFSIRNGTTTRLALANYEFSSPGNRTVVAWNDGTGYGNKITNTTVAEVNNVWYHYLVQQTPAGNIEFYINGNLVGQRPVGTSPTYATSGAGLFVGGTNHDTLYGWMRNLKIYNRAVADGNFTPPVLNA